MEGIEILNRPIGSLGLSEAFNRTCGEMGFETIADVLEVGRAELLKREGFSYHWLGELVAFLSEHKLVHLLQPMPGSNHG